jgi:hypothetical protein
MIRHHAILDWKSAEKIDYLKQPRHTSDMSASPLQKIHCDEYLNLPNPKKPSTTRRVVFDEINALDTETVKSEAIWPHNCSLSSITEWDERRSERAEGFRLQDPPGYIRGDDFKYTLDKNKINWSANRIELLRFDNAVEYLSRIKELAKGTPESKLSKDQREAVHPNKFGSALNLESAVEKRSDWKGDLRPRHAKVVAQTLYIYEGAEHTVPKLIIPLVGSEIKGYDAMAANTNPSCDLYGLGFTEDQARRVIRITPGPGATKRIPFYLVLPTYELRILWLYTLKRKAEDVAESNASQKDGTIGVPSSMSAIKNMIYNKWNGKK